MKIITSKAFALKTFIYPQNINTSEHFWGIFKKVEIECDARNLVVQAQKKNSWAPFYDVHRILGENHYLVKEEYIFKRNDKYCFTDKFVELVYKHYSNPTE